ncbi:hypothetical protein, partial [Sphingomonas sp. CCH9-E2]
IEPPPPPTNEQRAEATARSFANILEGVIVRAQDDRRARFKITRVYKGQFKAGIVIEAAPSWGFSEMPCPGMLPPPPNPKGQRGAIAFNDLPELAFVPDGWIAIMRQRRLIARTPDDYRVGTGSAPE